MSDDLVEQLEKALEQSEQREAQLNDRVSALEDILYLTEANLEAAEQRGYANAMEAERKLHEDRIEELEAKLGGYNLLWQAYELDKVVAELKGQNDEGPPQQPPAPMRPPARSTTNYCVDETREGRKDE